MHVDERADSAARVELAALRDRVSAVRGALIAGVDGMLIVDDICGGGLDSHDIAAMAAAFVGLGHQSGRSLRHGHLQECVIRGSAGHFVIYRVGERAVLAVLADEGLNLARLHLEARAAIPRLADTLRDMVLVDPLAGR